MSDKNYSPEVPDAYQLALNTIEVVKQERDRSKAREKVLEDALKFAITLARRNEIPSFVVVADWVQALAAKEPTATVCNCAGCNPANYPETNGWKCGMHTVREPKA